MKPKNLHLARSMQELNSLCKTDDFNLGGTPIKRLISTANKAYERAKLYDHEKDEESAYNYYSRYYLIFKEIIGRSEYLKDKIYYNQLMDVRRGREVIDRMEKLSQSLEKRYDLLSAARQAEAEEKKRMEQKELAAREQLIKEKTSQPLTNGVQKSWEADADGMLGVKALHTLITQQSTSFLLLDIRPADHYIASHAKLSQSINIPQHLLKKGLTAGNVSEQLDADARMQWNRRGKVDCLVIMDWGCEGPPFPDPIMALWDAIMKWDPSTNYCCGSPAVLKGGYELFTLSYPMLVTNPNVSPPLLSGGAPNGPSASSFPTLDFQYPDLDAAFIQSPPPKPILPPAPAAAPESGVTNQQSLSVGDSVQRPPASPQVTPRPLDTISHPVYPTSPAHKKPPPPAFNRSLKPNETSGPKSVPNGVLPQHSGVLTNGVGGPRASPEPGGGPAKPESRGAGPRLVGQGSSGSKGPVKTSGNSKSEIVVPTIPSRALKPFELINSFATDNMIEEKRLLEEKIHNDQEALEKLSALERPDNSSADTRHLRQELMTLQDSSARMEEALARISRENKDLWHCINSFVSNNNNNNNNADQSINGSLPAVASSPSLKPIAPPVNVPHIEGVSDRLGPNVDEQVVREVLATKATAHEQLLAKVEQLRKLRKEKEKSAKLRPSHPAPPASGSEGSAKTYHAPLKDSPPDSPHLEDSRSTSNLRRSHSAFDLSQVGESLSPSPEVTPEVPSSSGGSAFKRGMASLKPSIDRSIKPLQALSFRPRTVNAARKRDFGPICRTRSHTGLKNLGNTCYMNSIVQCLSNTQPFAAYFVNEQHTDYVNSNSPQNGEAAVEFGEVVKALQSGKYQSVAMRDFKAMVGKYNPEFRGNDQHDAHEFLMNLADWLHDDLNLVSTKQPPMAEQNHAPSTPDHVAAQEVQTNIALRDNSIVRKLFYGLHRNVITCLTCQTRSLTFEPFFVLTLSFPATGRCGLTDLLHHYYKESVIEYCCSQCRCPRQCVRKMDIWELPPVLIVHLNRFEQRDFLMTKNPNYVDFPLHHLMLERFVVDSPQAPCQNTDYSLYAVCNHYGTIDGGHYTAFCSSWPPGDSWHKYDDHEVYDLNCNHVKTSAAYVLFYQSSTYVTRTLHFN